MDGTENVSASFDDRMNTVIDAVSDEGDEGANPGQLSADQNALTPTGAEGNTELPAKDAIGEGKTSEAETNEPPGTSLATIEPPVSWPSDDKESFKVLPTWAQEVIVRRENDRESSFSQRSRTIAERERQLTDIQNRATQAQGHYLGELDRLNAVAAQLMPAKFHDIKNEADYLTLKVRDPARASEYDAFRQVLHNVNQQAIAVRQAQRQEVLDKEWATLQDKYPEFKTPKGKEIIDGVRKALVENYGFRPEEVEIIADHRHVPICRDAMAWRQHQAALRAAEAKKLAPQQPKGALRQTATPAGPVGQDKDVQTLNRARKTDDMRNKADIIAGLFT